MWEIINRADIVKCNETGKVGVLIDDKVHELGSGGVQPDMNAAPGEPGHILNRTHWKEFGKPVEILAETDIPYDGENDPVVTANELPQAGSIATVVWNGVSYSCTVYDASFMEPGAVVFGNLYKALGDEAAAAFGIPAVDTGEPFVISGMSMDGAVGLMIASLDEITSLTLGISAASTVTHKIPEEYLPETAKVVYMDFDMSVTPATTSTTVMQMMEWILKKHYVVARYNTGNDVVHLPVVNAGITEYGVGFSFCGFVPPLVNPRRAYIIISGDPTTGEKAIAFDEASV